MRIARGEQAVSQRKSGKLFQRHDQLCRCIGKPAVEEQGVANSDQIECLSIAWAEAQGRVEMLERDVGLTGKKPELPAGKPSASKARIEGETTVDQRDGGIDVLAEVAENEGRDGENVSVVRAYLKGSPGEIDALAPIPLRVFGPAIDVQLRIRPPRYRKGDAVTGIPLNRSLEQVECHGIPFPLPGIEVWEGAQIQIVGCKVVCRPFDRPADLGGLQCRFDDAGDADGDFILKLEDVF